MKNIIWLSLKEGTPARGYWDQYLFEIAFKDYNHSFSITDQEEAIVIIPGAYQGHLIKEINSLLSRLEKCVVIITSDEENNFPTDELDHKNMVVYSTYPVEYIKNIKWLPIFYPPQAEMLNEINNLNRYVDWFFAGQVNHKSRELMVENVKDIPNGELHISGGFSQGLNHKEYYFGLKSSKIVLCPNGNISPDSFRLYEALEAGCIPIVESPDFWRSMFKSAPFPVVHESIGWKDAINHILENYDKYKIDVDKWWKTTKESILLELRNL
jgi:hypothetical protein